MANVKVTLDYQINDGMSLTFKAPCDCTAVTGLKVYYPTLTDETETSTYQVFTFKDAHGNDLSNIGNLFTTDAYVKVVLDTTNGYAYIQNADTNGYLESAITALTTTLEGKAASSHKHSASDITSGILTAARGGTGVGSLEELATALGGVKIATGSYIGTGTCGPENPCSLTFDFIPRFISITSATESQTFSGPLSSSETVRISTGSQNYEIVTVNGMTVSWYSGYDEYKPQYQFNSVNTTYYYVAFG